MLFHFKMYIYLLTAVGTKRKKKRKEKVVKKKIFKCRYLKKVLSISIGYMNWNLYCIGINKVYLRLTTSDLLILSLYPYTCTHNITLQFLSPKLFWNEWETVCEEPWRCLTCHYIWNANLNCMLPYDNHLNWKYFNSPQKQIFTEQFEYA